MSNYPDLWRGSSLFRDVHRVQKMFERFFDDGLAVNPKGQSDLSAWSPTCEVTEDKDHYVARFEMPGMAKDQIKVEIHNNQLTVRAERKSEKKDDKKHYSEFSYGSFVRSFTLPTPVSEEKVEAKYTDGILTISLQKITPNGSRQIAVK